MGETARESGLIPVSLDTGLDGIPPVQPLFQKVSHLKMFIKELARLDQLWLRNSTLIRKYENLSRIGLVWDSDGTITSKQHCVGFLLHNDTFYELLTCNEKTGRRPRARLSSLDVVLYQAGQAHSVKGRGAILPGQVTES